MNAALNGFALGAGFIIAIGSQNAFVLRQGVQRQYVGPVVSLCILADVTLILCGVLGLGALLQRTPLLVPAFSLFGAVFLTLYGLRAVRRAAYSMHAALQTGAAETRSLRHTLWIAAAFTFFNPHVYLDTVILLGSLAATYHGSDRAAFALGAMLASTLWFAALGYGARWLGPVFAQPLAWRVLDVLIGISMLLIAARLWFTGFAAWQSL